MAKQRVNIHQAFRCSSETLFNFLAEHETLGTLFRPLATIRRLRDGSDARNGVGSARRITVLGLVPFQETYTKVVPGRRLEYTVSGAVPIKNHLSVMDIQATPQGCELNYGVFFDGRFPLAALFFGPGIAIVMRLAFKKLARQLN